MRIVMVEASPKGGLIHYSYQLCRALADAGADVTLVTSQHYELADIPHNFTVANILNLWDPRASQPSNALLRKAQRAGRGLQYVAEWFHLLRYLDQERPDVLLFSEVRFAFEYHFLQRAVKLAGHSAAIVHDVEMFDVNPTSGDVVRSDADHMARYADIYNLFDDLFVHDQNNTERFIELYDVPAHRVHSIRHGTQELMLELATDRPAEEIRATFDIATDRPTVVFFGALTKYKGLRDLIQAFPQVNQESNAQLVIAGFPTKDMDINALKELAKDLNIDHAITWYLDYVPNDLVIPLIEQSNVTVLPYRAITQSGVLQLAFAAGTPVVVTRVGGLPEVVHDGETGFVVNPMDPNDLARGILDVVRQPNIANRMGERAKQLSQTVYSWDTVAETVLSAVTKKTPLTAKTG